MSIIATYYRITPEQLERMKQGLEEFEKIYSDELHQPEFEYRMLDMGKAWEGIHFLLTDQKAFTYSSPKRGERYLPPLESIVVGGTPFDYPDQNIAYFTSEQVVEIADALRNHPIESVKENFDLASFSNARLYFFDQYLLATHKDSEELEEMLDEELFQYYEEMIKFFNEAEQNGDAIFLDIG